MAERDETGIAGDDVQPERRDQMNADDADDRQHIVAAVERKRKEQQRECDERQPLGLRIEQPLFGRIGFVKDSDAHG